MAVSEAMNMTRNTLDDVVAKGKKLYDDAREWAPENTALIAGVGGGLIVAGLLGFVAGRAGRRPVARRLEERLGQLPGRVQDVDLGPVFKFIKLWMLYRIAM
jgi:hypothetical protein